MAARIPLSDLLADAPLFARRGAAVIISRGARLCEAIIRNAKARKGGEREVGRSYLARRLGCSTRTVSRYTAELVAAGRLDRVPPRRERTTTGWRTVGCNRYRLRCRPHPAPHVQKRRSVRGDTCVTPSPCGDRMARASHAPGVDAGQLVDPAAAIAQLRALQAQARRGS